MVNKPAMDALDAGDAAGFARATGVAAPSEGFLAAAARPGSPFDPAFVPAGPNPTAGASSAEGD
jgi:hypothetical protein